MGWVRNKQHNLYTYGLGEKADGCIVSPDLINDPTKFRWVVRYQGCEVRSNKPITLRTAKSQAMDAIVWVMQFYLAAKRRLRQLNTSTGMVLTEPPRPVQLD